MKKIFTKFQISPILTLVLYIFHIISNISYYQLNFVWAWGGGGGEQKQLIDVQVLNWMGI